MSERGRERFEDLKEAYALDALSEGERREIEAYLECHPERRSEVDELSSVASLLALSPAEHEPPRKLRRDLMSTVRAEARRPETARPSFFGRLGELFSVQRLAIGAVAAVVLVGLISWNLLLREEVQDLQGQVDRGQTEERRSYAVQGAGSARQASGEVVRMGGERAVLVVENMPRVPEGQAYQIWIVKNDVPKPSGIFDEGGTVASIVEGSLSGAEIVAVTVEPAGGSPEPTSDPVLASEEI